MRVKYSQHQSDNELYTKGMDTPYSPISPASDRDELFLEDLEVEKEINNLWEEDSEKSPTPIVKPGPMAGKRSATDADPFEFPPKSSKTEDNQSFITWREILERSGYLSPEGILAQHQVFNPFLGIMKEPFRRLLIGSTTGPVRSSGSPNRVIPGPYNALEMDWEYHPYLAETPSYYEDRSFSTVFEFTVAKATYTQLQKNLSVIVNKHMRYTPLVQYFVEDATEHWYIKLRLFSHHPIATLDLMEEIWRELSHLEEPPSLRTLGLIKIH